MKKQITAIVVVGLFSSFVQAQETEADPIMRTEVVSEAPPVVTEPPARLEVKTQRSEHVAPAHLQSNVTTSQVEKKSIAQGLRVTLSKPTLEMTSTEIGYTYYGTRQNYTENLGRSEGAVALSIGYADFPQNQAGWSSNLSYIQQDPSVLSMWRFDGNLGIAFANYFILKGGLNVSGFNDAMMERFNPSIGYQGGLGVQITPNFGVDVSHVQMVQSRRLESIKQVGTEVSIHATF